MSVMFDDCISKKIVVHVPFNLSKWVSKFQIPVSKSSYSRRCKSELTEVLDLTRKYLLTIFFHGDSRVRTWFKRALEKSDNSLNVKVEKCVK